MPVPICYTCHVENPTYNRREFFQVSGAVALTATNIGEKAEAVQNVLDQLEAAAEIYELEVGPSRPEEQYKSKTETVTAENKFEYRSFEIGEEVFTVSPLEHSRSDDPQIQITASLGKPDTHAPTVNRLHSSWFTTFENGERRFRQDDYLHNVIGPIITATEQLEEQGVDTSSVPIHLAKLSDNKYGVTDLGRSDKLCIEGSFILIQLNCKRIVNPKTPTISIVQKRSDYTLLATSVHEKIHAWISKNSIPVIEGNEAISTTGGFRSIDRNEIFWNTEDPKSYRMEKLADRFYRHTSLEMTGTGSDNPASGYEHFALVEDLLRSSNLSSDAFFAKIYDWTTLERTGMRDCPKDPIKILERVFPDLPWPETYIYYLAQVLYLEGSGHNDDIFDPMRRKLDKNIPRMSYSESRSLDPRHFKYSLLPVPPDRARAQLIGGRDIHVGLIGIDEQPDITGNYRTISRDVFQGENELSVVFMNTSREHGNTQSIRLEMVEEDAAEL